VIDATDLDDLATLLGAVAVRAGSTDSFAVDI
jgi:hypothetical protein